jgi:hypothetical protein
MGTKVRQAARSYALKHQDVQQHNQPVSHNGRKLSSCDVDLDATIVHHLMRSGFSETLKEICKEIQKLSHSEKLEILAAKNSIGISGLYMALQDGHANTIKAYGELLKASGISGAELLDLLAAKRSNGTPGLYMALQNGSADTIKAYGELLKASGISGAELLDLLAAKRSDGTPGLDMALKKGHNFALLEYCKLIKEIIPRLNQNQRTTLLIMMRKSHGYKESHGSNIFNRHLNYPFYNKIKYSKDPKDLNFYLVFKETKKALKEPTGILS